MKAQDSLWNKIYCQDSRKMTQLKDESIHLMVTSPPYNVTKQYDENLNLKEYLDFIEEVHKEISRVLIPGGIVALNIANVGRKPYLPLDCYFIEILEKLHFEIIQEIIWDKAASAGGSCAWGSWQSASNPSLRDVHEYIIIARKPDLDRKVIHFPKGRINKFPEKIDDKKVEINEEELLTNLWAFGTESAKRVNHPAPFRVELPYKIILMFSEENDIILDPFMGSGSTALAAIIAKRRYVGYEINHQYIANCERRIDEYYHPEKKKIRIKRERKEKKRIKEELKKGNLKPNQIEPLPFPKKLTQVIKRNEETITSESKKKRKIQNNLLSYLK
nr:site-specific DNA-methyltransferase [Candidatus Prometheoarchaeum syntrophicum]QEE15745.1 Modification methylase MjaV [Candidatus Prometheoarchaeum syntrophicum]